MLLSTKLCGVIHARFLDWARVDETILINPEVRELLVTSNGYQKSYQGMDLRGANLIGADLSYAKMQTADLSQATLEAANLEAEQPKYLLSVMEDIVRPLSEQVVILNLASGDLKQGFEVTVDIWCDRQRLAITLEGKLPPKAELSERYQQWQKMYNLQKHKRNNRAIKIKPGITNCSIEDLKTLAEEVERDAKNRFLSLYL